jgi:hypothetical protein
MFNWLGIMNMALTGERIKSSIDIMGKVLPTELGIIVDIGVVSRLYSIAEANISNNGMRM